MARASSNFSRDRDYYSSFSDTLDNTPIASPWPGSTPRMSLSGGMSPRAGGIVAGVGGSPRTRTTSLFDGRDRPDALTWEKLASLRKFHVFLALLHLGAGAAMIVLSPAVTAPVFSVFADPTTRGQPSWAPVLARAAEINIGALSGAFLLLAGGHHLIAGTCARDAYEALLLKNQNPFRWVEYSISASVMHVLIACLSGIMDMHLLFTLFALTATTMMFGLIQEQTTQHQQGQPEAKSLLPFWIGCVPHAACWAVLFCHFFVGVQHGHAPAFVWAVIFAMFVLDASFAVNQYLQQRELGRWADYLFGEWVFALLSASAKLLLALLTFFGTKGLQPK